MKVSFEEFAAKVAGIVPQADAGTTLVSVKLKEKGDGLEIHANDFLLTLDFNFHSDLTSGELKIRGGSTFHFNDCWFVKGTVFEYAEAFKHEPLSELRRLTPFLLQSFANTT